MNNIIVIGIDISKKKFEVNIANLKAKKLTKFLVMTIVSSSAAITSEFFGSIAFNCSKPLWSLHAG